MTRIAHPGHPVGVSRQGFPTVASQGRALGNLSKELHRGLGQAVAWHRSVDRVANKTSRQPRIEDFDLTIRALNLLPNLLHAALSDELATAARYCSYPEIGKVLGRSKQTAWERVHRLPRRSLAEQIAYVRNQAFAPSLTGLDPRGEEVHWTQLEHRLDP